jgi:hypothetical protein
MLEHKKLFSSVYYFKLQGKQNRMVFQTICVMSILKSALWGWSQQGLPVTV